jgi:NAD(P)H dehydrogenase (quinone)
VAVGIAAFVAAVSQLWRTDPPLVAIFLLVIGTSLVMRPLFTRTAERSAGLGMKVLTVFAHPRARSFCHAVLERFDAGLREAGHTNEIVDLYAIGFDPILRERDTPSWLTETIPDDMLERMRLRENLLNEASGPLKRFALKRLIGDRDARGIIGLLRERYQAKDVLAQQQKVARAEALAFIAPVHFLSFPAILKGWLDRVWTPGFAYDLTPEAWRGDIDGRRPNLTHRKALIIQTTILRRRGPLGPIGPAPRYRI